MTLSLCTTCPADVLCCKRCHTCFMCWLLLPGNMMLFDAEGKIKRYDSPEEILQEFFNLRLQFYERRRVGLLQVGRWSGQC